jgi:hypothetical protein
LAQAQKTPENTELWESVPPVVTPGAGTAAPSHALLFFSGNDLDEWINQKGEPAEWVVAEGCLTVKAGTGMIKTNRKFGDCQLHKEWLSPAEVKGDGQGRGNSGIFLQEYLDQEVVKTAGRKPNLQY